MDERAYLSIGQVLDLLKVEFPDLTISKIRFLESQGLLDPERTPSGYRKFYEGDIDRLRFILREQQEHYLPLKVIRGRLGSDEPGAEEAARAGEGGDHLGDEGAHLGGKGADLGDKGADLGDEGADRVASTNGGSSPRLEVVAHAEPGDGVSMTLDELAGEAGLSAADIGELERFGLLAGRKLAGTMYYDADCLEIARLAAGFRGFGVEARHLRMYRTAVEREAGFFEQVVTPMLKQRNPQARRQAVDTLREMSRLGQAMRAAIMRQALHDYTGGS